MRLLSLPHFDEKGVKKYMHDSLFWTGPCPMGVAGPGLDHRAGHAGAFLSMPQNSLSLKQLAAWEKCPGMAGQS